MNIAVFADWTYDQVRARIVEMAETLRKLPAVEGPSTKSNNMPDIVRRYDEAYGFETARARIRATGAEIARMEECFDWINTYLGEEDRKLIYDYGFIKSRKGMYLDRYLERNDMVRRTFERRINRCCQDIALALNRKHLVRFDIPLDGVSQNHVEEQSSTVSSEKCATHWIAPDAKPQVDPTLAAVRVLKPRDIRARHSEKNRSLGAR